MSETLTQSTNNNTQAPFTKPSDTQPTFAGRVSRFNTPATHTIADIIYL